MAATASRRTRATASTRPARTSTRRCASCSAATTPPEGPRGESRYAHPMGRGIAWWMVALVGCASDHVAACGGPAPAIEDCETGVYHADCGGTGEQTFACSEVTGACRWFATACVAAEHVI